MNLDYGAAGQVFIRNLAVEYAQMIGASIGNLCIKASNGQYYSIDVDSSGNVTGTLTTVTEQEIDAGQTESGRVILETSITASQISTSSLLGTFALINQIDAARIDVDQLFARQAFIDKLNTSIIQSQDFIELVVGQVDLAVQPQIWERPALLNAHLVRGCDQGAVRESLQPAPGEHGDGHRGLRNACGDAGGHGSAGHENRR